MNFTGFHNREKPVLPLQRVVSNNLTGTPGNLAVTPLTSFGNSQKLTLYCMNQRRLDATW